MTSSISQLQVQHININELKASEFNPWTWSDHQLAKLRESIEKEVKKIRVTPKLQAKIDRHYAVAQNILRQYGVKRPPSTPLVEYSRFVLRSGSESEKTAFANGITNKIAVKNGEHKLT